jgi:hypothetical protein
MKMPEAFSSFILDRTAVMGVPMKMELIQGLKELRVFFLMPTTSSAHHSNNSQLKREVFSCVGPVAERIISVIILTADDRPAVVHKA